MTNFQIDLPKDNHIKESWLNPEDKKKFDKFRRKMIEYSKEYRNKHLTK